MSLKLKLMLMSDKTKKRVLWISISAIIIVAAIGISYLVYILNIPEPLGIPEPLAGVRPDECLVKPDIPEKVDDVRITVVERDCDIGALNEQLEGFTPAQIYYGYYSDNEWHDYPCENYDLIRLFWDHDGKYGYDAAENNHFVDLGSFILFAFPSSSATPNIVIEDTLNSEVKVISEYYTTTAVNNNSGLTDISMSGAGYAFLKENALKLGTREYDFEIVGAFAKWHYIIINKNDLDADYSLSYYKTNNSGYTPKVWTISYDEIQSEIQNAGK